MYALQSNAVVDRIKLEIMDDLGILFGLGVRGTDPEPEAAHKLAMQVTAPRDLYWLASRAGIGLHTESAMCGDVDMAAAVAAAFYARVRNGTPVWVAHPEAAANAAKAVNTVDGRVLAAAAQTIAQTLIASGYQGAFSGSPAEVAADIRNYLRG
jgi:hypothetical protein